MIDALYVDDELEMLDLCKIFLERDGEFRVHTAPGVDEAFRILKREPIDVVISDYQMPDKDGIAFLKEFRACWDNRPFILFSGRGREEVIIDAINSGVDFYLQKGGDPHAQFAELAHKIRQAIHRKRTEESLQRKHAELEAAYEHLAASGEDLRQNYEELAQSQRALRESEEQYRNVVEHSFDTVVVHQDGNIVFINKTGLDLMGASDPGRFIGRPVLEFVHPDYKDRIQERIARAPDSVQEVIREILVVPDGTPRDCEVATTPCTWNGRPAAQVVIRDITERCRTEAALRKSEEMYSHLVEQAEDGIVIVQDGIIRQSNSHFMTMLRYPAEDVLDRPIVWFIHPEDQNKVVERHARRLKGEEGIPSIYTFRAVTREGEPLWVELNTTLVDWKGRPATLNIVRDITERRRVEEVLQQTNKKLLLLSGITRHDVLNKLTVLSALIELSAARDHPHGTRADTDRQLAIIDQIKRIISFTHEYETIGVHAPQWQELGPVVGGAAADLEFGGVSLDISLDGVRILGDPLLPKVFYNLMDNSLRYGGDRMTRIRIFHERSGNGVTIVCEDDGTGVNPEYSEKLFERGIGENTGFGLFLAREILAITGICIQENGSPGNGARFEIRVPDDACRWGNGKENS